ncbi:10769_t:CDS:2 [Acaulospora colombiana]|uniref:10769_t:CDS:1 n=1 Tax=Acaulospora colombiana TaxID=27376 RepID=A0ACA9K2B6_9GLOM|nr:10769_t:CDS:2 [Acaulospora colombiana]
MDYQRQLLEELMAPYETSSKHSFWDDAVCKHFLVKFCPNSLFTNTKSDLATCNRYQEAPDHAKYGYEAKFYDYLQMLCNDLDKKIRKGNDRLNLLNPNKDEKEEKMIILDEKIKELLVKIEEAGEEGRVQEAQSLTKEVETIQKDLDFLKNSDDSNPLFKQERRMLVCEVCGAFLVTNDTSNRMDAHLQGKQHTGYKQIRETLHEWKKTSFSNRKYINRLAMRVIVTIVEIHIPDTNLIHVIAEKSTETEIIDVMRETIKKTTVGDEIVEKLDVIEMTEVGGTMMIESRYLDKHV